MTSLLQDLVSWPKNWFQVVVYVVAISVLAKFIYLFISWLMGCFRFYRMYGKLIEAQCNGDNSEARLLKIKLGNLKSSLSEHYYPTLLFPLEKVKGTFEDIIVGFILIILFVVFIFVTKFRLGIKWIKKIIHVQIVKYFVKRNLTCALISEDQHLRELATKITKKLK